MTVILDLEDTRAAAKCCDPAAETTWTAEDAQHLSDDLSILAHPIRLQILDILARQAGHVCVCDLEAALPVKQPTVSHHLKLLRAAGLIDCERNGQWAYYFVKRDTLRQLYQRINGRLDTLT